jgi:hypothetical protein
MKLSECGAKTVKAIMNQIEKIYIVLPTEISLKHLEELGGCSVQSIGRAFDPYIDKPLLEQGIEAVKCGKPVVIQLRKKRN